MTGPNAAADIAVMADVNSVGDRTVLELEGNAVRAASPSTTLCPELTVSSLTTKEPARSELRLVRGNWAVSVDEQPEARDILVGPPATGLRWFARTSGGSIFNLPSLRHQTPSTDVRWKRETRAWARGAIDSDRALYRCAEQFVARDTERRRKRRHRIGLGVRVLSPFDARNGGRVQARESGELDLRKPRFVTQLSQTRGDGFCAHADQSRHIGLDVKPLRSACG